MPVVTADTSHLLTDAARRQFDIDDFRKNPFQSERALPPLSRHLIPGSVVKLRCRGTVENSTPACVMEFVVQRIADTRSILLHPANVAALETTLRPIKGAATMSRLTIDWEAQFWGNLDADPLDGARFHLSLWHVWQSGASGQSFSPPSRAMSSVVGGPFGR